MAASRSASVSARAGSIFLTATTSFSIVHGRGPRDPLLKTGGQLAVCRRGARIVEEGHLGVLLLDHQPGGLQGVLRAALPRDDHEPPAPGRDHDRLDQPLGLDRRGQVRQRIGVEVLPRLSRVPEHA